MEAENISKVTPSKQGGGGGSICQRNKESLQRLNLEEVTRNLILGQIREPSLCTGVSIMTLLQGCLQTRSGRSSTVALSGYIEHFESKIEEDLGWGCGWRNIQMLSSYMLAQDPKCKDVLFGGAGFVPNIPAIQKWLEIAWLKGFDVLGAEYFDWQISGTKKWIGTTECATVMRSFGMPARIVDFRTAPSTRGTNCLGGQGESRSEKPSDQGSSVDEESNNFSRLTVSSSRRSSEGCSDDNPSPSHEPRSPPTSPDNESPEEHRLVVLPDQKEELHNLRQSPDDPDVCLTCMEEHKNSAYSNHLHTSNNADKPSPNKGKSGAASGSHPPGVKFNHKYMADWIWNYFNSEGGSSEKSIYLSNRSPLYFQHRGHSRTIVGMERHRKEEGWSKDEDYLIVLDPSQRTSDILWSLQRNQGWEELVKRGTHCLNQSEYQLCYIDSGVAKGAEHDNLKTLSSVRYMY